MIYVDIWNTNKNTSMRNQKEKRLRSDLQAEVAS